MLSSNSSRSALRSYSRTSSSTAADRPRCASMLSTPEPQIRALIRLLSDEDERVARTIAGKLAEIGAPAVPLLREAEIEQPEMAARISEILDDIQGQRLEGEFHALSACEDEDLDLETGAFLIAQFAYPNLDVAPCDE